ncbi:hypothetical protein, partial [Marinobacter sp.]|uniref:hypothetical protein n=1 Tax=Marinobacter sp. TaxID=50741 RepID=UPI003562BEE7
ALGNHHRKVHQQGIERCGQSVAVGFVQIHTDTALNLRIFSIGELHAMTKLIVLRLHHTIRN